MGWHVYLNDADGEFGAGDEGGNVFGKLEQIRQPAAFEVGFAVEDFLAVHLGLLREDAGAEIILLNLGQGGFVGLEIAGAQNQAADEEERGLRFVKLGLVEIEQVHGVLISREAP